MLEFFLVFLVIILLITVFFLLKKMAAMQSSFNQLLFSKQSQSVKYGKLTEQWLPFVKEFPFNAQDFRFIGSPVDGIVFDENAIVFCEFKSNSGVLSEKQKRVRELVENRKVEWKEFTLK